MSIETEQAAIQWRGNYENASALLNQYYDFYRDGLHPILAKWVEICIQCAIFITDISFEVANISALKPVGFARKLAYKGLLLRLVEFQNHFDVRTINEDLKNYVTEMNKDLGEEQLFYPANEIADFRKRLTSHFNEWDKLKIIRNNAAGHYKKISVQLPALEAIDPDEVDKITLELFTYMANTLNLIASIHPEGFKLSKYSHR
ncbi:hypothetical protein [Methyloradius palustris]|nr:hypothetical protein [Methyloradius palustris]